MGFYVNHIIQIANPYTNDIDKLKKLTETAILTKRSNRLNAFLHQKVEDKEIITTILQIVQIRYWSCCNMKVINTELFPFPHYYSNEQLDGSVLSWPSRCKTCKQCFCKKTKEETIQLCFIRLQLYSS